MSQTLKQAIAGWDGKSSEDIDTIYSGFELDASLVDDLLLCLEDQTLQSGATWLLKRHLVGKGVRSHKAFSPQKISAGQILCVYKQLPQLKHWSARLHLLQTMDVLPIALAVKDTVEHFLRRCLADDNKFVRAWAYSGFHLLQQQYPEYKAEVDGFFALAMQDEAASVKARIRNILKRK
ncbi:MAG: hypothetical protein HRT35_08300 [Algicola sp.]|nr:hypothetical protein [Algicola sp.]